MGKFLRVKWIKLSNFSSLLGYLISFVNSRFVAEAIPVLRYSDSLDMIDSSPPVLPLYVDLLNPSFCRILWWNFPFCIYLYIYNYFFCATRVALVSALPQSRAFFKK